MPMRGFSRDQVYLLPPSLDEWVPSDHSVRYVAEFVAALEPEVWTEMGIDLVGEEVGAPAYHPEVLLSVWLAGFMLGIRSSRKLESACRDQISFRWLTGNQLPDHNTLWRFYRAHRQGMRQLLRLTVRTAQQAGLLDLALLVVDGTKVAGNAARERTHGETHLAELERQVSAAIAELEAENTGGEAERIPRLPESLRQAEALHARVQQALTTVRAENGPTGANTTDPDTRLHKTRQGYVTGYNAQAGVVRTEPGPDQTSGMLMVAADVVSAQADHGQLVPMLEQSRANLRSAPSVLAADGGYYSTSTVAECRRQGQVVVMPDNQGQSRRTHPYQSSQFTYDVETDCFTCPHGHQLAYRGQKHRRHRAPVRMYRPEVAICRSCPAFGICTTNGRQGRELEVPMEHMVGRQHRAWMQTESAKSLSARRKSLVEPVFGIIKEWLGLRRFLLRGLAAVQAEWNLLAVGFNLRTLARAWAAGRIPDPDSPHKPFTEPPHPPDPGTSVRCVASTLRNFVIGRRFHLLTT